MIALLASARLFISWRSELTDTEAYYVGWARWPALSYYDHPPLVAWTTWLVSHVGTSALVLRLASGASAIAFALLLHRLAKRMFGPRAAFLAVAIASALPAFLGLGILVNPESLLAPIWLLVLTTSWDLRDRDEWWRPLVLGAAIGAAFLAKYTGLLAVPLVLAWVASSRETRRWLRRPTFWLAGFVALAFAVPVIAWNAQRDFPSVSLHFVERVARPSLATYAHSALHTLGSQLFLFQPLACVGFAVTAVATIRRARTDARYRFLSWMGPPMLAFFLFMMIRVRDAEAHWTASGYVALTIALGALLDERLERLHARAYLASIAATSGLALAVFMLHLVSPLVTKFPGYDPNGDPVNETFGWDRIARAVSRSAEALGDDAVVAGNHNVLCGHLEYALHDWPNVYCASERRTQFDFVGRREIPRDVPVVYVDSERYPRDPSVALEGRRCALDSRVEVTRGDRVVQSVRVWSCPAERRHTHEPQARR